MNTKEQQNEIEVMPQSTNNLMPLKFTVHIYLAKQFLQDSLFPVNILCKYLAVTEMFFYFVGNLTKNVNVPTKAFKRSSRDNINKIWDFCYVVSCLLTFLKEYLVPQVENRESKAHR